VRKRIDQYREIVGDEVIAEIYRAGREMADTQFCHINSTYIGGGVAEMLNSLIPLMNDAGIETEWRLLYGTREFFSVTKQLHNALQGQDVPLNGSQRYAHEKNNEDFSVLCKLYHDCVVVHDPQPLPIIKFYPARNPWVWRCHIDVSHPEPQTWSYIQKYILRYSHTIFSHPSYGKDDLPVPQSIIHPSIDPLNPKNIELSESAIGRELDRAEIDPSIPIIAQVSRFDPWKDPLGVVEVFERVRQKHECQLVLIGGMASDDPEGQVIYEYIVKRVEGKENITVLVDASDLTVNAVQSASSVVIQKSLREGFGLTVAEALWKGTPVVASDIGGIPLQIENGLSGYLVEPNDIDGFTGKVLELLREPDKAEKMGQRGHEYVLQNFLITRHLLDYVKLYRQLLNRT